MALDLLSIIYLGGLLGLLLILLHHPLPDGHRWTYDVGATLGLLVWPLVIAYILLERLKKRNAL